MALTYTKVGGSTLGSDSATGERGILIKIINRTGGSSVKGTVVSASAATDKEAILATNLLAVIGVVQEASVAEGSEMWVWTTGSICQVLLKDGSAATRGGVLAMSSTAGRATPASAPATVSDKIIGNAVETKGSGTNVLALTLLQSDSRIINDTYGAALPSTPQNGQLYTLTLTGRSITYIYNGSSWTPMQSNGAITLYVDTAAGTDSITGGTASGASALKTIQYAVDMLPGRLTGSVTINIAAGTYAETVTIEGKSYTGNYGITLVGTMTELDSLAAASGTQGTTSTQGTTVRKTGTWTSNQRQQKVIRYTSGNNNGVIRIIESNTTDTITIVGAWDGSIAADDTFVVEDWGTIITSTVAISNGQKGITLRNLKMSASTAMNISGQSTIDYLDCCWVTGSSLSLYINKYAAVYVRWSLVAPTGGSGIYANDGSYARADYTLIYDASSSSQGFRGSNQANCTMSYGTIIDGFTDGIYLETNSIMYCANPTASYCRIKNNTDGIHALTGAQCKNTTNNQYSGNSNDENAVSASYGYID